MNFTDFEQIFSTSDESDPLMMLVWIVPIIIFVFYGQQIQLLVTSGEIKKAIKKLDKSKIKVRPATSGGTGMTLKASIVVTKSEEKEQQMMRKK